MLRRNCATIHELPFAVLGLQQVDIEEVGMSSANPAGQRFQIATPNCVCIQIGEYTYGQILEVEIKVSAVTLHNSSENQNLMFATLHHFCVGISESLNYPWT